MTDALWIIVALALPVISAIWFPFEDSLLARRRALYRRERSRR